MSLVVSKNCDSVDHRYGRAAYTDQEIIWLINDGMIKLCVCKHYHHAENQTHSTLLDAIYAHVGIRRATRGETQ